MTKAKETTQEVEMTPKLQSALSLLLEKLPNVEGKSIIIKDGKLTIK